MSIGGTCGKCGAPWFYDHVGGWYSILPPPIRPSCACWNVPQVKTATHICCSCCTACHICIQRQPGGLP